MGEETGLWAGEEEGESQGSHSFFFFFFLNCTEKQLKVTVECDLCTCVKEIINFETENHCVYTV